MRGHSSVSIAQQGALRTRHAASTARGLTACLEGLPSCFPLSSVFRSLLRNQVLSTQRLAAGLTIWTEPRRLATCEMSIVHRASFLWRLRRPIPRNQERTMITASKGPKAGTVDMKLEVAVIPVSDV